MLNTPFCLGFFPTRFLVVWLMGKILGNAGTGRGGETVVMGGPSFVSLGRFRGIGLSPWSHNFVAMCLPGFHFNVL